MPVIASVPVSFGAASRAFLNVVVCVVVVVVMVVVEVAVVVMVVS